MRTPPPTWAHDDANNASTLTEYAPMRWWQRRPRASIVYVIPDSVLVDIGRDSAGIIGDLARRLGDADTIEP